MAIPRRTMNPPPINPSLMPAAVTYSNTIKTNTTNPPATWQTCSVVTGTNTNPVTIYPSGGTMPNPPQVVPSANTYRQHLSSQEIQYKLESLEDRLIAMGERLTQFADEMADWRESHYDMITRIQKMQMEIDLHDDKEAVLTGRTKKMRI